MSSKFVLSYRREGDGARVEFVKQLLISRFGKDSVDSSLDEDQPGQDFRAAIDTAIRACDTMFVLIGPDWLSVTDGEGTRRLDDPRDPVRLEVTAAIAMGKRVIPVLLDGARMPRPEELPAELVELTRRNALRLNTSRADDPFSELQLDDALYGAARPEPPRAPPSARPQAPPDLSELTRVMHRKMGGGFGSAAASVVVKAVRAGGRLIGALLPSKVVSPPAPSPVETARRVPKMSAKPSLPAEPVLLGVTAPRSVLAGAKFNAVLAAYVESARVSAQAKLERLGGNAAVPLLDISPDRQSGWIVGAPVTVRVTASHADVEPAERSFEWNGRENLAAFSVRVHDDAPGTELDLCFHVALANVPIAYIPLPVALSPSSASEAPRIESIRAAHSAFASYSSKDAQTVGYCLSMLTRWSPGLDIFQDCLDLDPNEKFKPQLAKRIGSSDVFMLFWSRNASASPWVHWEYDTARNAKGLDAVIPMPLEDPKIAPPPPEFDDAHMRDRFMMARYGLAKIDEVAAGGR